MNFLITYIKNSLDTAIFLLLLMSVLSYWFSIMFPNVKLGYQLGFFCIGLSNCCTLSLLAWRWVENGYFPLSNLYESLLFFTWGATFITLVLEVTTTLSFIGGVMAPLAMFTVGFATLSLPEGMQKAAPLVPALKSNWLMMHVSVMMLSYSTLIVGSLLAIVFLFLNRTQGLSKGSSELLYINCSQEKLHYLDKIDNLSYRIIGFGFPMLTIGIITGAVWANEAWGSYWSWDPKETWALITWLVFASYLHLRLTESKQSKGPAILASIGFVVVWICYLGVNFLGKGLHSYGWVL
jgi:cytochrome c-type biogenesis protein CcsB|uniref:heme attachment to plastid cytochrome c n=1 Tax=Cryptomonas gyropyrenoidosa TaxID=233257 RepID=UPI00279F3F7F|nr:heme attachment to plastid cytochrome c [Cryptomonas gyropyrenoidosa]WFQ82923.1 heme attachment to plastid cytochrome c [Cryptomonas gyropyrenoidosa]